MKQLVEVTINEALNEAVAEHVSLQNTVREYKRICEEIEELEKRKQELKGPIEEAIALRGAALSKKSNSQTLAIGNFVCTLIPCEGTYFNWDRGKALIAPAVLEQCTKRSQYTRLSVKGKE